MRIGILSDLSAWEWAGCEELWLSFAEAARREGHDVFVFLDRRRIPDGPRHRLESCGAQIHFPTGRAGISHTARRLSWRLSFAADSCFPRFAGLEKLAPDFLLLNLADQIPEHGFRHELRSAGVLRFPYFTLTHSSFLFGPPPATALREEVAALYRGALCSFFVAERTWHQVEHVLATRIEPARIVRNPVNLEGLAPVAMPPGDGLRIASVGRLATQTKGQDLLIAALGSPEWRQRDWRLSLYGNGPHEETLKAIARHYGVADRVLFRGFESDVRKIWSENNMLAIPSHNESAPLVLVEAMLCGRPAVVNDVGGICEWVSEPETGFISEFAGIEPLRAALERAWQSRGSWPAMGERARERALRQMDSDPGGSLLRKVEEHLRRAVRAAHA